MEIGWIEFSRKDCWHHKGNLNHCIKNKFDDWSFYNVKLYKMLHVNILYNTLIMGKRGSNN